MDRRRHWVLRFAMDARHIFQNERNFIKSKVNSQARRQRIPNVDTKTLARYYEISPQMLEKLRHQRLQTLDYCNDHHPVLVENPEARSRTTTNPSGQGLG